MAKTNENLKTAFAGESQANRKYLAFAKKAEEEGKPGLAKLFRVAVCFFSWIACYFSSLGAGSGWLGPIFQPVP